ncbi:GNAT family N-acetyltransferase [Xanthovirga aplysinae]|uniref:GNAT family N-acetyltransferase n=1 Tax=Xanthovirga aplysinae TaxID=2529853 RepID=UPI0012BCDE12|nr:GNAT family N-acetyltransferase [Xanthovirga aplysinae]MTI33143.1 GNAT family N-acetyltransferase [Xanthovirga aplysinae]
MHNKLKIDQKEVLIRRAKKEDVSTVLSMIKKLALHHHALEYVTTNEELLLKNGFNGEEKFGVLLAEVEGEVAGFVSYTINYSIWLGASSINIDDVFVESNFRSLGIGRKLMIAIKEEGIRKGYPRIRWEVEKDNIRAIKFYEELGAYYREKGIFVWEL